MCLQFASQGEKYDGHRETTRSGDQNSAKTRQSTDDQQIIKRQLPDLFQTSEWSRQQQDLRELFRAVRLLLMNLFRELKRWRREGDGKKNVTTICDKNVTTIYDILRQRATFYDNFRLFVPLT